MQTAKIFKNGQSQAVRLPKEFRFEGAEVYIKRVGNSVMLTPKENSWKELLANLGTVSDDFMSEREQPEIEDRGEMFD